MPERPVTLEVDADGIAWIALDRPQTRNALSDEVLDALLDALETVRVDDRVRCVVLRSTHARVFSAGGDLREFATPMAVEAREAALDRFPRLFTALSGLGKPSICAAGGHVLAGAVGLMLACDLVIAVEGARFGTPELDVGLFPFMVAALLTRDIGRKRATELLLLGESIDADEAERIGLVNRVLAPDAFDAGVAEWAHRLAARSPLLLRMGKDALHAQRDLGRDDAVERMRGCLADALATRDGQEGIAAFLEKRPPVWCGR